MSLLVQSSTSAGTSKDINTLLNFVPPRRKQVRKRIYAEENVFLSTCETNILVA